jgi:hypothetical protein
MKNSNINPYLKSVLVICSLVAGCLLFKYIGNKDVKTLIGMSGFFLLAYSNLHKNKVETKG